jgi:3-methylfumaryl-CoA hydratase
VTAPHDGDWSDWVGRSRAQEDVISLSSARALAATLDRDPAAVAEGDPLPPGWHWVSFPPLARRSDLGADGIEARGSFLPPIPLPRRMWAGGRLRFPGVVRIGERATRISTIESVRSKRGRTGPLVFVTVRHRVEGQAGVAVDEEQDLVFREEAPSGTRAGESAVSAPAFPDGDADWSEAFAADEVTLFRFSALTFNGHRIHYDHPYVTGVERYPGVVVHGPLIALLLLDAAVRRGGGTPALFSYRAVAPLFCGERFLIERRGDTVAAVHPERGVAMEASVER